MPSLSPPESFPSYFLYTPLQPGILKSHHSDVTYTEVVTDHSLVYRYWELRTRKALEAPFDYLVLPDACIDMVFDLHGTHGIFVMTPGTNAEVVALGQRFHYVGVRFHPGVFTEPRRIIGQARPLDAFVNLDTAR